MNHFNLWLDEKGLALEDFQSSFFENNKVGESNPQGYLMRLKGDRGTTRKRFIIEVLSGIVSIEIDNNFIFLSKNK